MKILLINIQFSKDFKNITIKEKKVDGNFAYLSGELENINGVKSAIEFQLIKENNQWKIQAMRLAYVKSTDSILTPGKAVDNSGASIKGILVSNEADAQGYVSKSKTQIPGSAQKIFARGPADTRSIGGAGRACPWSDRFGIRTPVWPRRC